MIAILPHFGAASQGFSSPQWGATGKTCGAKIPAMGNNLKKLRESAGFTHERVARLMGMSRGGFIKLERGERRLTSNYIVRAAEIFGVPESAVLSEQTSIAVMGRIGAGAIIEPDYEQTPPDGLFSIDLPFPVPDDLIGFVVKGESMMPRYDDGDVIVVWKEQRRPIESFIGEEAAVRTESGRRYLKTIAAGGRPGIYELHSFNAKPLAATRLAWIGEIYITVRAAQVRRIGAKPRKPIHEQPGVTDLAHHPRRRATR